MCKPLLSLLRCSVKVVVTHFFCVAYACRYGMQIAPPIVRFVCLFAESARCRGEESGVPDPGNGKIQVVIRRRRTRRHRRHRIVRRGLAYAVAALVVASVSSLAMRYFSPSLFGARQSFLSAYYGKDLRNRADVLEQILAQTPPRPVYPYSVVPGGIEDARELKWFAEHDPVVAAHYAGFNYDRAQVVRLTLARTVYVSYRIGNHIYWTSHRVTLHKGEKLITDGTMTARTRCGNRVEETPQQQAASASEPAEQKMEQPVGRGTAIAAPPVPFQSALLNRPQAPEFGPMGPLALYDPFMGGGVIQVSVPPLEGGCEPPKKVTSGSVGTKKKKIGPCGSSPVGPVPEPGTWALFASGLAAIGWQFHRRLART